MSPLPRIAFRNVLRNRRRSLITFSAVFLALSVMVSIRGLLNGMQASICESVVLGQTGALQVHRRGYLKSVNGASLDLDLPADAAFLGRLEAQKGVRAVAPRIGFGGMLNAGDNTTAALFTAIDPAREAKVCPRRFEALSSGKSLLEAAPGSGVFTPELAAAVGLRLGARAALLTNDKDSVMNALELDYAGSFGRLGLSTQDKKLGFVPLGFAQSLLRMEGRATEVAIAVERLDEVERMKPLLQSVVGPDYEVSTWRDVAPWVDDAIAAQNFVLGLLAGIFLFVALLGIANTMLMSVFERTREIGTMMSVGVRRSQILTLFLMEAAVLGLCGGVAGAGVGGAIVGYYGHRGMSIQMGGMPTPMHIIPFVDPGYVLLILALASLGAGAAALWPSLRASRLRPVQALAAV